VNKARDNSGYNTHIPPLIMPGRVKCRVQEVQIDQSINRRSVLIRTTSPPLIPGVKRTLFSQALLISFREFARLVLIFEHKAVMFIYVPDSLPECNHGIPLTAPGAIDPAKFSDCLRSKLHMLSPGPVVR
jgi:hypothetical protein